MSKTKNSKHLVIDASVARSCGAEGAVFPTSKNCRDFLKAVLEICHHMAMSTDVMVEWKKHESAYARTWRVAMIARKKVQHLKNDELLEAGILISKISKAIENPKQNEAFQKDQHLILTAKATDLIVISLDDEMRGILLGTAEKVKEIKEIMWVNPDKHSELMSQWLLDGAKSEKIFLID